MGERPQMARAEGAKPEQATRREPPTAGADEINTRRREIPSAAKPWMARAAEGDGWSMDATHGVRGCTLTAMVRERCGA